MHAITEARTKNENKGKENRKDPKDKQRTNKNKNRGTDTKWTHRTQEVNDTHRKRKGGRANTREQQERKKKTQGRKIVE
jgi:hypothetical protein